MLVLEKGFPKLRTSRLAICAVLSAVTALGCSSPDNLVEGGILGTATLPNATIAVVGSALSATGNITDESGNTSPRQIVLLADAPNLCATLATDPTFLQSPTEAFTALVLTMPPGMVGTFYAGAASTEAGLYASAGNGNPVYGYPGVSGTIVVQGLGAPDEGTFDLEFDDTLGDQYEVYGNFKTTPCDALSTALIPSIEILQ